MAGHSDSVLYFVYDVISVSINLSIVSNDLEAKLK